MEQPEEIVKRLMTAAKCTACGAHYEIDKIRVLGHQNELWFVTVTCSQCHTHGLVAAVVKNGKDGKASITRIPTPKQEEGLDPAPRDLRASPAVTEDDVLGMHQFLKEFDGDFAHLFEGGEEQARD